MILDGPRCEASTCSMLGCLPGRARHARCGVTWRARPTRSAGGVGSCGSHGPLHAARCSTAAAPASVLQPRSSVGAAGCRERVCCAVALAARWQTISSSCRARSIYVCTKQPHSPTARRCAHQPRARLSGSWQERAAALRRRSAALPPPPPPARLPGVLARAQRATAVSPRRRRSARQPRSLACVLSMLR